MAADAGRPELLRRAIGRSTDVDVCADRPHRSGAACPSAIAPNARMEPASGGRRRRAVGPGQRFKSWEGYRGPALGQGIFQTPGERTDYFEQNPQQALRSFRGDFGGGLQERTILGQLDQVYGQYLQQLQNQLRQGQIPQGGIVDYLEGSYEHQQPFDWQQFFFEQNPGMLARRESQYTPGTRYLY